ncbi:MAG: radical SAM protein [Candidatus Omnitrophica bacterium]|nr:radical SAM protein [Candidatus Omnitrophota bacterium]
MSEKHERVLLVNPPESGRGSASTPPVGLLYCAGVLQKQNIPVGVIDGFIDGWHGIVEKAVKFKPTLIGITCPTYARSKSLEAARLIKKEVPGAKIIFGGPHATIMGEQLLKHYPFIDMVAIGESDFLIPDICNGVAPEDIPGVGFRRSDKIVLTGKRLNIEDLDTIPFPAWNLISPRKYSTDDRGIYNGVDLDAEPCGFLIFSRGCIGNCNFCSNKLTWNRWRCRSPKNMADEIELINKEYGIRHFHFNDDCFSTDSKAVIALCDEIVRRGLKIYFDIVTRADCVDEALIKSLKMAGCYKINFGIETASSSLLKIMGKSIDTERPMKAIRLTLSSGVQAGVFIIAGCLGETWKTVNETIDFLSSINGARISVSPGMMVFPGTRLYEHAKKKNFINEDFWLTDYNWKIYTAENSRLQLNIYAEALRKKKKLSRHFMVNALRYHRFLAKEAEYSVKALLAKCGIKKSIKKNKYKVAY